eukprot:scaffold232433_cov31-Tisochrysis_lutea.AAC.1
MYYFSATSESAATSAWSILAPHPCMLMLMRPHSLAAVTPMRSPPLPLPLASPASSPLASSALVAFAMSHKQKGKWYNSSKKKTVTKKVKGTEEERRKKSERKKREKTF